MYNLRLTHKEIGVKDLPDAGRKLDEFVLTNSLDDYVLLRTCNRAELYYNGAAIALQNGFIFESGKSSFKHLMRVACGLESFVVGETEILGQLRSAYKTARQEGHCSGELSAYFETAIRVGRKARYLTDISKGKVSIVSLALDYVQDVLGDLRGKRVLVIGAGNIGSKVARAMQNMNIEKILVANRHYKRAVGLAREIGAESHRLSRLDELLPLVDVVICATSAPHLILTRERVGAVGRKLVVVDLSVPGNVDESIMDLENIRLVTFNDLKCKAGENLRTRKREVEKIERIIDRELENGGKDPCRLRRHASIILQKKLLEEKIYIHARSVGGGDLRD